MIGLSQDITYWAGTDVPDEFGFDVMIAPIAIKGHWEDRNDLVKNPNGGEFITEAIAIVDTDLKQGGFLFEGKSTVTDPITLPGAHEIMRFDKIKGLSGGTFRKAYM